MHIHSHMQCKKKSHYRQGQQFYLLESNYPQFQKHFEIMQEGFGIKQHARFGLIQTLNKEENISKMRSV